MTQRSRVETHAPTGLRRWLAPWTGRKTLCRSDGQPYLDRWHILPRNPVLNIHLHRFVGDDDDACPHYHPWHSLSILLRGAYWEAPGRDPESQCRIMHRAPAVIYRLPEDAHRILLPSRKRRTAWTLFITGPRVREWGFWHTRTVWHRHDMRPAPQASPADPLPSAPLLTTRQAAQALGVARTTVQRWVKRGELKPAVPGLVGSHRQPHRFRVEDLQVIYHRKKGGRDAA